MRVNSSETNLSVSSSKSKTSIGGVVESVKMYVFIIMMVHALSVVGMEQKEMETNKKTTDVGASAEGEYLKPAQHVAMDMGSVSDLAQCISDRQRVMTGLTPEWAKSLKSELKSTVEDVGKEVTSKINLLGKDFNEFKISTEKEITTVKGTIQEVAAGQKKLEERITEMERQKTTWETGVKEDMRRLSSIVVVPNRGPRQEDVDEYLEEFDKMKRSVGLAPFTNEDFRRISEHLVKHKIPSTKENILSASLMDFWEHDLGIDQKGIETLSSIMEDVWWTKMPKRKGDNEELHEKAIYARFKDESGKLTMYVHAKWMNNMCKKKKIEPRRILMDICPQLERRFGALNKLQHRFRHEQEAEMGQGTKVQTRIDCFEETIVLQYRFDDKEAWRNLDAEKHFKKEKIPGVYYGDKVPFANRPRAYRFQGVKTPPGRARSNVPIRNPELNPPRMSSETLVKSGNNNQAAPVVSKPVTSNYDALKENLLDISSVQAGEDPFASLDPSKPSFVHPQNQFANIFKQTPRLFHNGETGETTGNKDVAPSVAAAKKYEITIPGGAESSTDTSVDGLDRKNKRKKSSEAETDARKTRKKGSDKKKTAAKEKTVKTKDIAEMLKAQAQVNRGKPDEDVEGEVGDEDEGEVGGLDLGDPGRV